ncbi:MAG: response regulator [bacterium]|nr:response regulator [bacterium]
MSTIIIIEDNAQSARLAARLLRKAGHEVLTAEDGETGLQTVFEHMPDVVLIDLGLPDIDGQTVIVLLRDQPELAGVPIVAFTAYPIEIAQKMAETYGCAGVITKPIDTHQFAGQVSEFLKRDEQQL